MDEHVKTRSYTSAVRAEQAEQTKAAILRAARSLFVSQGYQQTTVQQIAAEAGVNVDTIYHSVGRKPALMRALIESSISGQSEAVPAAERDYVLRIREAVAADEMIEIYAAAITQIQQRMAPIFLALRDAATTDESCRALWKEISDRRAGNMLLFASDLRATGELRDDLDDQQVGDIIWSMNSAEYWNLLVEGRGWTADAYERWIVDAWKRLLLAER